jgi:Arc/MetJ family transcription regulator
VSDTVRTNVVLDQELIEEAMALTGLKTKRAVIEEALRHSDRDFDPFEAHLALKVVH